MAPKCGTMLPAACIAMCFFGQTAFASGGPQVDLPDRDVSTGPSVAYVHGPAHGIAINWDTAFTWNILSASVNFSLFHYPDDKLTFGGGQLELTAWFLLNWGFGAGYQGGSLYGPSVHTFVGFPIGDDILPKAMNPFNSLYVEPYVRCHFFFPDGLQFMVEAGILIKITTWAI